MLIKEIASYYLIDSKDALYSFFNPDRSYFEYIIIQKNKKERKVYIPNEEVKLCQQYVLDFYLSHLKCHENAMAYIKGRNIVSNISIHKDNNFFLHLDIKHFFDDMQWDVFKTIINRFYSSSSFSELIKREEDDLKTILLYKNMFVQGSVTAPYISNIYLYEFDVKMTELSKKLENGKYSRYSDDIYLSSSKRIDSGYVDAVSILLKEYKLKLNYKKIKYYKLENSVKITGISLTKDRRITLPNSYKNDLKKRIYFFMKKSNHSIKEAYELYGRLCYLKMIDLRYYNYLQVKYMKNSVALSDYINSIVHNKKADNG